MFYYIDQASGSVYAYSSDDVDNGLVIEGLRRMTDAEVNAHLNPPDRYWTDGSVLVLTAASYMDGMWLATDSQIADLMIPTKLKEALAETARLRQIADTAIVPLQDAVDVDDATEDDKALLTLWKKYRVALNRLPDQEGYPSSINWPAPPA